MMKRIIPLVFLIALFVLGAVLAPATVTAKPFIATETMAGTDNVVGGDNTVDASDILKKGVPKSDVEMPGPVKTLGKFWGWIMTIAAVLLGGWQLHTRNKLKKVMLKTADFVDESSDLFDVGANIIRKAVNVGDPDYIDNVWKEIKDMGKEFGDVALTFKEMVLLIRNKSDGDTMTALDAGKISVSAKKKAVKKAIQGRRT